MEDNYFKLQDAVFDALLSKHNEENGFCFTLRKNYNKDTYRNYFTGTSKSSYFSFSLWYLKNSYPGASVDPIVYRVILRDGYFRIEFQLHQTKSPDDEQNKLVLQLLRNIEIELKKKAFSEAYNLIEDIPSNKMFKVRLRPSKQLLNEEDVIPAIFELIKITAPIVHEELGKFKSLYPYFEGNAITKDDFDRMVSDRENRIIKAKESLPTFREIIEEIIELNNLEDEFIFDFKEINDHFLWIGDNTGLIGNLRAHYEIQLGDKKSNLYVRIHFEEGDAKEIKEIIGEDLPKFFKWNEWSLGTSIEVGGFEMISKPETPILLFEKLKSAEYELGDKIRSALKRINSKKEMQAHSLNQILYGPPGTGKTYSTIDKVVQICDPENYKEKDHDVNKLRYNALVEEGRVVFTTFHQSMSYEDFIEGIKPSMGGEDEKALTYEIEPGIFKQIANSARQLKKVINNGIDWENVNYYKMSLGGKSRPDIHNWCIENEVIGLGWGGEEDLSALVEYASDNNWIGYRDQFKSLHPWVLEEGKYHIQATYALNKMRIGDVVVISKGNHLIDAIGRVVGDYYFDDSTPNEMCHYRKVEWIVTGMDASPDKFIDKQISQQSIYEFYTADVKKTAFKSLTSATEAQDKPYVLVIDEINRGNVSAIFGELITLIEEDKRLGANNELKVTLPYSKDKFGVPSNLYIIGTMNTADRSVEALDTALRRRFTFEEMLPNPSLLTVPVEGISLEQLLTTINERIEVLVDRDHTIGHAFFMDITSLDQLRSVFANKVIPLLQEYFYGDYSKMEMVIGSDFFNIMETSKVKFAVKSDNFDPEGKVYHIKNVSKMEEPVFRAALTKLFNAPD